MRINFFVPLIYGLVTLLGILFCNDVRAQTGDTVPIINFPLSHEDLSLYDFAEVRMETDETEKPPPDITKRKFQPVKELFEKDELYFADSVQSVWFKFTIINNDTSDASLALVFPGSTNKAVLYKKEGEEIVFVGKTGWVIAVLKRTVPDEVGRIDMILKANSQTNYFLQIPRTGFLVCPKTPALESAAHADMKAYSWVKKVHRPELLWFHFFTGVFFMFFVFGFIKYLVLGKDRAYLYYSLMGLFSALLTVAGAEYPPFELSSFENLRGLELSDLVGVLALIMQALFILEILQLKIRYPRITRIIKWYLFIKLLLYIANTAMWLAITNSIAWNVSIRTRDFFKWVETYDAFFYLILILFWVVYLARIRKGFYRFIFLGALTIFIAGILVYAIRFFHLFYLLPAWFGADPRASAGHLMQIALLIDLLFYFTGLAHRERQVERDKINFQEQLITQLEANKVIQEKFTGELEQQVKEKTAEVVQEKAEVESTLQELKSTQAQLIQREKMASLGELTAGVAHEIQNPINFVNNFSEVNKELIEELYEKQKTEPRDFQSENEILNDIDQNLEKVIFHGKRADAIVKGMLQHSRSSTDKKELADINALADEYFRLSYHGLRAKDKSFNAMIETDFDENIGKINIVPQDIGRVLLNLFNNAFYSVAEKNASILRQAQNEPGSAGQQYQPTVSVSTKKLNDKVEIKVRDNGNGIPPKVLDKIFQPFFTTKPTGQGTGLGLSISYDIVKAHGGEIKAETKEGEGAEFIILLPVV